MPRLRWLVGLFGVVVITTIGLNKITDQRNAAFAADESSDLLKRVEVLEARVAMLEGRLVRPTQPAIPSPSEPRYWNKREFNGAPVYIVPLGEVESRR